MLTLVLLASSTSFVNPFVGTDGVGHTSPAAALAFDRTHGDVGTVPYAELRKRLEAANHVCCI